MSFRRFIASIFNTEICGEETVASIEKAYRNAERAHPGQDPHSYLASAWLTRAFARGHDVDDPDLQSASFLATALFACVPPPQCATALGLYVLYKERPDIVVRHEKFQRQYASLMEAALEAQDNGTFEELYSKYNKTLAENMNDQPST